MGPSWPGSCTWAHSRAKEGAAGEGPSSRRLLQGHRLLRESCRGRLLRPRRSPRARSRPWEGSSGDSEAGAATAVMAATTILMEWATGARAGPGATGGTARESITAGTAAATTAAMEVPEAAGETGRTPRPPWRAGAAEEGEAAAREATEPSE